MVIRATGNLSGGVVAAKGQDLGELLPAQLDELQARGLARDDGEVATPPVRAARAPRPPRKVRK